MGAARTPIGRYGGAFRNVHPAELGAVAARAALERAGVEPAAIDEVLIGHARQAGLRSEPGAAGGAPRRASRYACPRRRSTRRAPRACRPIASGAQSIMLGESDVVVAGGIESMSRMPYLIDAEDARWGHRMGNFTLVDAMYRDGFSCSLSGMIMGETAEVLARAVRHHARDVRSLRARDAAAAAAAIADGRLPRRDRAGDGHRREGQPTVSIDADEHPRPDDDARDVCRSSRRCSNVEGRRASSPRARRPGSPTAAPRWC